MGETARERIRIATRACEGLRPKDVVMEALLAFAGHIGARRVTAVSRANHVGRQRHTPREIQCDYEGFWMEYHGTPDAAGNVGIPVRQPERDIAEIASKKRSAWRRKQALAQTVRGRSASGSVWIAPRPPIRRRLPWGPPPDRRAK